VQSVSAPRQVDWEVVVAPPFTIVWAALLAVAVVIVGQSVAWLHGVVVVGAQPAVRAPHDPAVPVPVADEVGGVAEHVVGAHDPE
jgi:hypothetical protein